VSNGGFQNKIMILERNGNMRILKPHLRAFKPLSFLTTLTRDATERSSQEVATKVLRHEGAQRVSL